MWQILRSCLGFVVCVAVTACDTKPPETPQPQPQPPGTVETITGRERIGWDQQAADRVELGSFRYALYVDGVRNEVADVTCANTAGSAGFACSSSLPALSLGMHVLELAAFVTDGSTVAESGRSTSLRVSVVAAADQAVQPLSTDERPELDAGRASRRSPPSSDAAVASDRVRLRLERVADGLHDPTDAAFTSDGRLWVAERRGRIRVLRDGRFNESAALTLEDAWTDGGNGLKAIAIDPQFERTRFVYVIYTTTSRAGDPVFRLVRFREVNDTLAEPAVLLDDVPAPRTNAAAALRVGPDGKLYAAFDDGGDARRIGDLSSYNAKILRLNADGTTPADQAGATPVIAEAYRSPRGIDWRPGLNTLWIAGRSLQDDDRVRAVAPTELRSTFRRETTSYVISGATRVAAMTFYRGDLFPALRGDLLVTGGEGTLLRLRLDPADPTRVARSEPLFDAGARIDAVAVGPNGAIYLCSNTHVSRLTK